MTAPLDGIRIGNAGRLRSTIVRPMRWPRWVRRLFLLTLPVAGVAWFVMLTIIPIAEAILAGWRGLAHVWSAPPRQSYRYGYHDYFVMTKPPINGPQQDVASLPPLVSLG